MAVVFVVKVLAHEICGLEVTAERKTVPIIQYSCYNGECLLGGVGSCEVEYSITCILLYDSLDNNLMESKHSRGTEHFFDSFFSGPCQYQTKEGW